jgi:hypothetical protein
MQAPEVIIPTSTRITFCHFDLQEVCEMGLDRPDSKLCAKCVADAYGDIVRTKR